MEKALIKAYAELIAKVGGAVHKGQSVVIRTPVGQEEFAALVAKECYKAGAKRVVFQWQSSVLEKLDYKYCKTKDLGTLTPMEMGLQEYSTNELPVLLWLDADDPDGLKGADAEKLAKIRALRYSQSAALIEARANKYQWCIAGCPSAKWAQKVFPDLSKHQAIESLWEAILKTARAEDGNGIANWEAHDKSLKEKSEKLNSFHLKSLHYHASNGTELTIGLIPGVSFLAGGEKTIAGIYFQPNIPSEECFTSPKKGEAEGIAYSSKPLIYQSQLIDKFWIRFHEGKAVDCHAEAGEALLRSIFALDGGSAYLGEASLVPFDSPINQTGLVFFNTLYDENACCHLALGAGFTELYPAFEKYSETELHGFGINKSLSHVDFMIGTADLSIIGTDVSGKEIPLFANGTWAF
jgi:aminopeptidase